MSYSINNLIRIALLVCALVLPVTSEESASTPPNVDLTAAVLTSEGGPCFLTMAVQIGDTKVVSSLLAGGYSVEGRSTLQHAPAYFAVITNKADCFYLLLEAGEKDVIDEQLATLGGWRLLSLAVLHDADRCVELALDYGAKINTSDHSEHRPVFLAIRYRSERAMTALLSRGGRISSDEGAALSSEDRQWVRRFTKPELIIEPVNDQDLHGITTPSGH